MVAQGVLPRYIGRLWRLRKTQSSSRQQPNVVLHVRPTYVGYNDVFGGGEKLNSDVLLGRCGNIRLQHPSSIVTGIVYVSGIMDCLSLASVYDPQAKEAIMAVSDNGVLQLQTTSTVAAREGVTLLARIIKHHLLHCSTI